MHDIEVLAIEGLNAAIIGSTLKGGREVLAYDYDKAVAIIMASGHDEEYAENFIAEMSSDDIDGAPAFVYLDYEQEPYGFSPPTGSTVH
tara:strand:+ start:49 stop:315 length:267 start_codon:yes stop_codon:yes gene_type:complete